MYYDGPSDLAENAKFGGGLVGINVMLGILSSIVTEFHFGTKWSLYSHDAARVFGVILAIEGQIAILLGATFVDLSSFGRDKLTRVQHLMVALPYRVADLDLLVLPAPSFSRSASAPYGRRWREISARRKSTK